MPWLMQFSNAGRSKIAGGQDVQRVEPAAGLADVLDDEVAPGSGARNQSSFSNGTWFWANDIEPESNHTSSTSATRRIVDLPGRVVGVGPGQLVDVRPVQVGVAVPVLRQPAEVALELLEGAVDVDPRVRRVVGLATPAPASPRTGCG